MTSHHHDRHYRRHRDVEDRDSKHHHRRRHRDADDKRPYKKRTRSPSLPRLPLPFNAAPISTRDYDFLSPIFASYLSIQKDLSLNSLDTREAKGRFKSFVSH
jgi:hypothetical protein